MSRERRLLVLTRARTNASFRQRIEPFVKPLAERGIDCEVVELSPTPGRRFLQMRTARQYDGVLLHRKTATVADALALAGVRRWIYDFDDAVVYQARAPAHPHRLRRQRFRRVARRADLVIAGAPELQRLAESAGARRVAVIPTGLDTSRYSPSERSEETGIVRLVWIGSRSTLKQLASFRPMLAALSGAAPAIALRVIADAPLELPDLAVENLPWHRDTEARLLAESDIGISPLPDTPYTRGKCGFKILQYMAAGLPVIASPVGVHTGYVRGHETGLLAGSTAEWIEAVRALAASPQERRRLGHAGRERVESEFDLGVLAPRFCDAVAEALA